MTPFMARRLPGAATSDCRATVSRAGTRCRMALTVVSRIGRTLAAFDAGEPRQRRHALRHHGGVRRDPVVGQAVPGREFEHFGVRREEGERARERRHARAVAADHRHADRGRLGAGRNRAGEVGDHQALGAVGDSPATAAGRREALRRRGCRPDAGRHGSAPPCVWKRMSWRSTAVSNSAGASSAPTTQA